MTRKNLQTSKLPEEVEGTECSHLIWVLVTPFRLCLRWEEAVEWPGCQLCILKFPAGVRLGGSSSGRNSRLPDGTLLVPSS